MMHSDCPIYDAVIVGGGFYGAVIASYLARQRGFLRIMLVEREAALLTRASYNNQARVHNGYHYPRSFTTAYRSRVNLPRFVHDWPGSVKQDFVALYAVARTNSKVTAKQFERFCRDIGARIQRAEPALLGLFEPRRIENVYLVEEYVFDASKLANWAEIELSEVGVEIHLGKRVTDISIGPNDTLKVAIASNKYGDESVASHYVFNCTYSGLNQFGGDFRDASIGLKHEITELALMQVPPALEGLGITVMDGSFFSLMPFPARNLHTLSHVRYTPHLYWEDRHNIDPYQKLQNYDKATRADRMVRDVARYMPSISRANYIDSLFEVKTVLAKNEGDDGRPILFEKHRELPGCYSVLGGKIDNIFDVLEKLDSEPMQLPQVR